MRVLVLSRDFSGASLCYRLAREGHAVQVWISDRRYGNTLQGLVDTADDYPSAVAWVGTSGLIVADHVGIGQQLDQLRAKGYSVAGGSAGADLLDNELAALTPLTRVALDHLQQLGDRRVA